MVVMKQLSLSTFITAFHYFFLHLVFFTTGFPWICLAAEVANVVQFGRSVKRTVDSRMIGQYGNGLKS